AFLIGLLLPLLPFLVGLLLLLALLVRPLLSFLGSLLLLLALLLPLLLTLFALRLVLLASLLAATSSALSIGKAARSQQCRRQGHRHRYVLQIFSVHQKLPFAFRRGREITSDQSGNYYST